jgi:transposase-like protein
MAVKKSKKTGKKSAKRPRPKADEMSHGEVVERFGKPTPTGVRRQRRRRALLRSLQRDPAHAASHLKTYSDEQKKELAVQAVQEYGTVAAACRKAGISRGKFTAWLKEDKEFAALVAEANEIVGDDLEELALERAKLEGNEWLLFAMLKGHKKDRYSERKELTGKNGKSLPAPAGPQLFVIGGQSIEV